MPNLHHKAVMPSAKLKLWIERRSSNLFIPSLRKKILFLLLASLSASMVAIGYKLTLPSPALQINNESPKYILVDQFGYRPNDAKVAVISQPCFLGQDHQTVIARLQDEYSLIETENNEVAHTAIPELWNGGEIHEQSGDCAAWFDFSSVSKPGKYIIQNNRTQETSWPFLIDQNVYRDVLIAATRMFYYQRSGFPKQPPFADPRWSDDAAFLGPGQDTEARFVEDKHNSSLSRDMRGGWFDAGDTNKYVTFASIPVHQLLDAFRRNPALWTDDFNIPESENGIPDLLDEVRYELDWLKRMQAEDGGVFIKIGTINYQLFERPSLDPRPRFYASQCSSATIDAAGMFAHASLVFQEIPGLESYAQNLKNRAIQAWQWYHTHPHRTDCDTQEIKAGDADRTLSQQADSAITAAIYLSSLTASEIYENYIVENLEDHCFFCDQTWYPYHSNLGDALLFYAQTKQSSDQFHIRLEESLKKLSENSETYGLRPELTPYQAHMPDDQYHWGSNAIQALYGINNLDVYNLLTTESKVSYYNRALEALHYFHGVNPLGLVYLSNMYNYGADYSVNEIYHDWFGYGVYDNALTSENGPAPGYLTGGPNKNYTGDATISLEYPMRSYLDSNNKRHSMHMWELSEPAIYYQSAYVKLISQLSN